MSNKSGIRFNKIILIASKYVVKKRYSCEQFTNVSNVYAMQPATRVL